GSHTFTAALKTAGQRSVTVTDTAAASLTASVSLTVNAAAAASLSLTGFPSSTTAGDSFSTTLTAMDAFGNLAAGYAGTLPFTSPAAQAVPPCDPALPAADRGTHAFTAALKTAGQRSVTVMDTATPSLSGSGTLTVNAAATALSLSGLPSSTTAGAS